MFKNGASLLAGVGVGAGLAYYLDPARGNRRRARLRDVAAHSANLTRRAIGTTSRDVLQRTYGTAVSLSRVGRHDELVDDEVLIARVRAKLGRIVSHPHAIDVTASNGVVTLSGPILKREVPHLVRAVRRVRGVHDVLEALDVHEQAGSVPSLQGGRAPAGDRPDVFQYHWSPTTRLLMGTAGAALALAGLSRRGGGGATAQLIGIG